MTPAQEEKFLGRIKQLDEARQVRIVGLVGLFCLVAGIVLAANTYEVWTDAWLWEMTLAVAKIASFAIAVVWIGLGTIAVVGALYVIAVGEGDEKKPEAGE